MVQTVQRLLRAAELSLGSSAGQYPPLPQELFSAPVTLRISLVGSWFSPWDSWTSCSFLEGSLSSKESLLPMVLFVILSFFPRTMRGKLGEVLIFPPTILFTVLLNGLVGGTHSSSFSRSICGRIWAHLSSYITKFQGRTTNSKSVYT